MVDASKRLKEKKEQKKYRFSGMSSGLGRLTDESAKEHPVLTECLDRPEPIGSVTTEYLKLTDEGGKGLDYGTGLTWDIEAATFRLPMTAGYLMEASPNKTKVLEAFRKWGNGGCDGGANCQCCQSGKTEIGAALNTSQKRGQFNAALGDLVFDFMTARIDDAALNYRGYLDDETAEEMQPAPVSKPKAHAKPSLRVVT